MNAFIYIAVFGSLFTLAGLFLHDLGQLIVDIYDSATGK